MTQLTSIDNNFRLPIKTQVRITFVGPEGNIVGLAVDVADGIVFFETTYAFDDSSIVNIPQNALWWVSATGGANQIGDQS